MKQIKLDERFITPSKIVCVGQNYYEHIKELGHEVPDAMVFFCKPNTAITNELQAFHGEQLHYEGELCFIYEAGRFAAVGFGIDVTKRELQSKLKEKGLPWERAKAFDGAAVFSQFIEVAEVSEELTFELHINDELIQQGTRELMMYKPETILAELQTFMTLNDGDVIMTGTPKGVGVINVGDVFTGYVKDKGKTILTEQWTAK